MDKIDYQIAALRLRIVGLQISEFLRRGNEAKYKNMKQVSPGTWIHNDFKDITEALEWAKGLIPT